MIARTMIYLEAEQLAALKKRARSEKISVAELVRRLVKQYLGQPAGHPPVPRETYAALVGLGESGKSRVADDHDRHLARALDLERLR